MYEGFWRDTILNNLAIPLLVVLFGILIAIAQHYANKFVKMFTERQKVESVEKIANARARLIAEIDKSTEGAVASTMDMVDKMKEGGKKLTEEQIAHITNSAKSMVYLTIPKMIGEISADEILGGPNVVEEIINVSLEKYVLEYKIRRAQAGTGVSTVNGDIPSEEFDEVHGPNDINSDGAEDPTMLSMVEDYQEPSMEPEGSEEVYDGEIQEAVPEEIEPEQQIQEPDQEPEQEPLHGLYVAPPLTDTGGISLI